MCILIYFCYKSKTHEYGVIHNNKNKKIEANSIAKVLKLRTYKNINTFVNNDVNMNIAKCWFVCYTFYIIYEYLITNNTLKVV